MLRRRVFAVLVDSPFVLLVLLVLHSHFFRTLCIMLIVFNQLPTKAFVARMSRCSVCFACCIKAMAEDSFVCQVCQDANLDITGCVYQCKERHLFCEECWKVSSKKRCPTCRVSLNRVIRNRAVESFLDSLPKRGCLFCKRILARGHHPHDCDIKGSHRPISPAHNGRSMES
jgi:hypothetical protein